ncbi:hypothetical protein [Amycolatopsis anabasis]|uniref:hypothetical protein n=1 Tax=Amycolatopsis anabasis TaxID=1840409 RepID=UPI00131B6078|nr:hypothetical protein [Amycolatopsis anabasis]
MTEDVYRLGDQNATHTTETAAEGVLDTAGGAAGFTADRTEVATASVSETSGALSTNTQHLEGAGSHDEGLTTDPATGAAEGHTQDSHHLGGSDATTTLIGPADGVGGSTVTEDAADAVLTRNAALTRDARGNAHVVSEFFGEGKASRGSGHGFWFTPAAGGEIESAQAGRGCFTGTLDVLRDEDGTAAGTVEQAIAGEFEQRHAAEGHLGPLSAKGTSSQSGTLDLVATHDATSTPDGGAESATGGSVQGLVTDHTGGEVGIENVVQVSGDLRTEAAASDLVHESTKDGVPEAPAAQHAASVSHEAKASLRLLRQAPLGGGLSLGAPPLNITPSLGS